MSDNEAIQSLLTDEIDYSKSFAESQSEWISDINNGNYSDGRVKFDNDTLTSQYNLHDMVSLPLRITPESGTFSANPQLAAKGSILSAIRGIHVSTGSGTTIIDEKDSLEFSSHLALLLENSQDWAISNGAQLCWAKDRAFDNVFSGLITKAAIENPKTAMYTGAVSATANSLNDKYNVGFVERNRALLDQAIENNGTYVADKSAGFDVTVYIPLRYIHSFFEQLDFPLINVRLHISLYLNLTGTSSEYLPFCLGTLPAGTVETGTGVKVGLIPGEQCRLYYRRVLFKASENHAVVDKLSSGGFKKVITYSSFEINKSFKNISGTSSFTHKVHDGIRNAKRVWALVFPAGSVDGNKWPSPIMTGPYGLIDVNIRVNNTKQFANEFKTLQELWNELKKAMPPALAGKDTASQLTFSDFVKTHRIHCFDISRYHNNLQGKANDHVRIEVNAKVTTNAAVDIVYLVEREVKVELNYGEKVVVIKSDIDG